MSIKNKFTTEQSFTSIQEVIKIIMNLQENDGKIDLSEGIEIIIKSLDEITKIFTDDESGKLSKIIDGLKSLFNQLNAYLKDGHISKLEIIMLSIKIVQLIINLLD